MTIGFKAGGAGVAVGVAASGAGAGTGATEAVGASPGAVAAPPCSFAGTGAAPPCSFAGAEVAPPCSAAKPTAGTRATATIRIPTIHNMRDFIFFIPPSRLFIKRTLCSTHIKLTTTPTPIPAPATTSLGQCTPRATRETATRLARPNHQQRPLGQRKLKAPAKAKASVAWPDGNESPLVFCRNPKVGITSAGLGRPTSCFNQPVRRTATGIPNQGIRGGGRCFVSCRLASRPQATALSAIPSAARLKTTLESPR